MDQKTGQMFKNQKGFTLVEVITVLVILGVLAAVAMPKFTDLTGRAKQKAADGAVPAGLSNATTSYMTFILNNSVEPTDIDETPAWVAPSASDTTPVPIETKLGDYTADYEFTKDNDGNNAVKVIVTSKIDTNIKSSKTFTLP